MRQQQVRRQRWQRFTVIGEPARRKYFNFELTEAQTADPVEALKAIKEKVTAQ